MRTPATCVREEPAGSAWPWSWPTADRRRPCPAGGGPRSAWARTRQASAVKPKSKTALLDKLKDLHKGPRQGGHPEAGPCHLYRPAGRRGLAARRSRRPGGQHRPEEQRRAGAHSRGDRPRKLREPTAADVRRALSAMAAEYSSAAVITGHLALKRAIRHAQASDLVSRYVAAAPARRLATLAIALDHADRSGHRGR